MIIGRKKVTVYDTVEKTVKKDQPSRLHARRDLLIASYIYVELQSIQLFHYFFFQTATFSKLFSQCLLIRSHSRVELFFCYINIINLYIKVLTG